MFHELKAKAKGGAAKKARHRMGKSDIEQDREMIAAAVHKHEKHDHPGKPMTKLREGGSVHGHKAKSHLAKRARGGRSPKKGHTTNIIIAGHPGGAPAAGPAAMPARPMPGPVAAPGAVPPGAMAGGPPPGAMPPGPMPGRPMMNRGGKVKTTHPDVGGGGGLARIKQNKFYGKKFGRNKDRG